MSGDPHALRNELALSSEVASDETSLYRWLRYEDGSSSKTLVDYRRREPMGVRAHMILALLIYSEEDAAS
jgi:hypothetical protein